VKIFFFNTFYFIARIYWNPIVDIILLYCI
jgi:hypothetical protein